MDLIVILLEIQYFMYIKLNKNILIMIIQLKKYKKLSLKSKKNEKIQIFNN